MIELFSLKHRIFLLTGATGYLGKSMALGLASAGAKVLINGRDINKINLLVDELVSMNLDAESAYFDVTNEDSIEEYFKYYPYEYLSGIINNAYAGRGGTVVTSTSDDYINSYQIAVLSVERIARRAIPLLKKAYSIQGDASVINIASMYGLVSPDHRIYKTPEGTNPPFYGAAKAALLQWTRYAACELGQYGIRVNSVSPGPFPSKDVQKNQPEFIKTLSERVPLGRIGDPKEISGVIIFLSSKAASFISGANISVDGGWTAW